MQSVSRQIEIARLAGNIQVCQGESDSVQLVGGYPAGVVSLMEPPQPSMAKRTDHELIIPCAGTAINGFVNLLHTATANDGCPPRRSMATLNQWRSPNDSYSTPPAGRRSWTRRSWRSFSASRTPRSIEALADLLADGIVGRVSHGTSHVSSSQRYHLTTKDVREAAAILDYATPSDYVRAYPMFKEWLTLLMRRMDAIASVYPVSPRHSPPAPTSSGHSGRDRNNERSPAHSRGRPAGLAPVARPPSSVLSHAHDPAQTCRKRGRRRIHGY